MQRQLKPRPTLVICWWPKTDENFARATEGRPESYDYVHHFVNCQLVGLQLGSGLVVVQKLHGFSPRGCSPFLLENKQHPDDWFRRGSFGGCSPKNVLLIKF